MTYPDNPQIVVPVEGRVKVRLPFEDGANRSRLKRLGLRPQWDREAMCWRISRSRLADLKAFCISHYDVVEIWSQHLESQTCSESCQTAKRDECVCSCLGENHGGGAHWAGWETVSDKTVEQVTTRYRRWVKRVAA